MRFNDSITAKFAGSKEYHELEIVSMDMDKDIACSNSARIIP